MPLVNYRHLGRPEAHIDLRAPPAERWRAFGRDYADELHSLLRDIVVLSEEHFQGIPRLFQPLARAAAHGTSRVAGRAFAAVAGWYGSEYIAEIKGLAAAADAPFSQVFLANLIYDLTQFSDRWADACACSSFSCNVRGRPVLARNMDWCWPDSVGRHTVLVRFHHGRKSYLSIGVVGLVGVLTAMHKGHLAVALNQAPAQRLPFNAMQWPALHRLRAACDGFGTFGGFVRRLTACQTMSPFFAHIVGVRPEEQLVVGGMGREFAVRRKTAKALVQTNHFVDDDLEHLNPPDEFVDADGGRWTPGPATRRYSDGYVSCRDPCANRWPS
ncbi:MAG: hypothetical protein JNK76_16855 [Planctomycetales bacterium]|nr:hypothetical protein [Planctomycetales bacterium]MBN8624927.1 hypothetical protein [Planctomycetota bacterium]